MSEPRRFDPAFLDELRARTSLVALIGRDVRLVRRGREHVGVCPFHREKSGSFTVNEDKGFAHCFGCGAHVDAIGYLVRRGLGFVEAVQQLAEEAGLLVPTGRPRRELAPAVPRPAPEDLEREKARLIAWARDVWAQGRPWAGTPVEAYLRRRGLVVEPELPTLRYAPRLPYRETVEDGQWREILPAMVAPMQQVDGRITGIHRTYLTPDGCKADVPRAKKMGGVCWGAAIRFARATDRLAIGEGIETCLSVRQAVPGLAVWAAGSLGNIAGSGLRGGPARRHPTGDRDLPTVIPDPERPGLALPDGVEEVLILADADGDRPTGEALVERAARRWHAQGVRVRVAWPTPGRDFNDMLTQVEDA